MTGKLLPRGLARSPRDIGAAWLLGAAALLLPAAARAQVNWTVELSSTTVHNFPTPLRIHQDGSEELRLSAAYASRPFEAPVTWDLRLGRWRGGAGWELELLHHKLYLEGPPEEVQRFAMSHGYNLLLVSRAWRRGALLARVGGGLVVAHPESTIRGRPFPETGGSLGGGYHLAGPAVAASLGARVPIAGRLFLGLEAKLTAARGDVPVAGGEATVTSLAAHAVVGLGVRVAP